MVFVSRALHLSLHFNYDAFVFYLGVTAFYHGSSAALFKAGQLICAIEEERFSKIFMIDNDARNRKGCILKDHSCNGLYEIKGCYFLERSKNETEIVSIKDKNLFSILLANSICGIPRNKCLESEESLLNNIGMFIDSTSFYNYKRPLDDNINFLLDHISSVEIK